MAQTTLKVTQGHLQ